jgi:hypothetical protein
VTLLFLLAGVFGILAVLKPPVVLAFGGNAVGRVEEVTPSRGGRTGHPDPHRFNLVFTYQLPGDAPQTENGLIDTGGAKPPAVGQTVRIRVLRIGGVQLAELRDGNPRASGYLCAGLFLFVWCGGVALFTLAVWLAPLAARALVRDGTAAAGTVMGTRRRWWSRTNRCEILYRFTTAERQEQSAFQFAASNACDAFWEGQTVTVIYDVRQPARSTIYEASDYEVA